MADRGQPALELARQALASARADFVTAERLAVAAMERCLDAEDAETATTAERALGLCAVERGAMEDAARHLQDAVQIAERAALPACASDARLDLALAYSFRGDWRAALRETERAAAGLEEPAAARVATRRALILQRWGHLDEALGLYRTALATLRRAGDAEWQARLLCNRGVLHAYRGDFRHAEADLARAERLYESQGQHLAAAQVRHNLGFVAAARGDIPCALERYHSVDREYRRLRAPRGILQMDRCAALLSVRLAGQAREAAEQAVAELERTGMASDHAEALLMMAGATVLDDRPEEAARHAHAARAAFAAQERATWATLAQHAVISARFSAGERTPSLIDTAAETAEELSAAGWTVAAVDACLIAGRLALELGRDQQAELLLGRASSARRRGPMDVKTRACHAQALLCLRRGDRAAAQAAIRAGLRVVSAHRDALGGTELRAAAAAHADELALLGLRLALTTGRPRHVLASAERWRAGALEPRPVRPPHNRELAAALIGLRKVVAQRDEAVLEGRNARSALRRQAQLERRVRDLSHHAPAMRPGGDDVQLSIGGLSAKLGERALVELVQMDDELHAVAVVNGRACLRRLGPVREVRDAHDVLRTSLRRLSVGHGSVESRQAAARAARHAARRLDGLLLGPLRPQLTDRELVLVPTGVLHALPWAALPSLTGRPVTVAPSARLWLRARRKSRRPPAHAERLALVAGPGLANAVAEVEALCQRYARANCLTGEAASVAAAKAALEAADVAHVAAHGTFRFDNPLFSCLKLADGPLTVYDLEGLAQAPRQLILSACDSGLSAVKPGDELMGLVAALLAIGTETLIACVAPVSDAVSRDVMLALHEQMQAAHTPAAALAHCQTELRDRDEQAFAVASAFVCFGFG